MLHNKVRSFYSQNLGLSQLGSVMYFSGLCLTSGEPLNFKKISTIALTVLAIGTAFPHLVPDEFKVVIVALPKMIQMINAATATYTGSIEAYDLYKRGYDTASICCIAHAAIELYALRFVDLTYLMMNIKN